MAGGVVGWIIGKAIDTALGPVLDLADKYLNKEISRDELEAGIKSNMIASAERIEIAHARELTEGFKAFVGAAKDNQVLTIGWAFVLTSQTLVLLWHQVGISAFTLITGITWPSSGSTVDWAYALVALCLGGGALAIRSGSAVDSLKALTKWRK